MARPRLLLVPWLTELEWRIKPQLEEWADVLSYDAPGIGSEPSAGELTSRAVADRALAEIDRARWDSCVVVADEFGNDGAAALILARPSAVSGLALGHASLSHAMSGDRAPVNGEVYSALNRLAHTDYRTYIRHLTQVTQGAYDDELVEKYVERVPVELENERAEAITDKPQITEALEALDVPLLFARHEGCLLFTPEGFEDAARRFPGAETVTTVEKPSASPKFADTLRSLFG